MRIQGSFLRTGSASQRIHPVTNKELIHSNIVRNLTHLNINKTKSVKPVFARASCRDVNELDFAITC